MEKLVYSSLFSTLTSFIIAFFFFFFLSSFRFKQDLAEGTAVPHLLTVPTHAWPPQSNTFVPIESTPVSWDLTTKFLPFVCGVVHCWCVYFIDFGKCLVAGIHLYIMQNSFTVFNILYGPFTPYP